MKKSCWGKRACKLKADTSIFYNEHTDPRMRCRGDSFFKQYLWVNYRCSKKNCLLLTEQVEKEINLCIDTYEDLCLSNTSIKCYQASIYKLNSEKDCFEYTTRVKDYYDYWLPSYKKVMCKFPKCSFNFAKKIPKIANTYKKITEPEKHYVIDPIKCLFVKEYTKLTKEGLNLENVCQEGSKSVIDFYNDIFQDFDNNHEAISKGCKFLIYAKTQNNTFLS